MTVWIGQHECPKWWIALYAIKRVFGVERNFGSFSCVKWFDSIAVEDGQELVGVEFELLWVDIELFNSVLHKFYDQLTLILSGTLGVK